MNSCFKIKYYLKILSISCVASMILFLGYLYLASINMLPFMSSRMMLWAERLGF